MDIRIHPHSLSGEVAAPASKSVAHRLLICAAMADGKSTIKITDTSEDIKATANCLKALGTKIEINEDNWDITPSETLPKKIELDCGESGSTLRFLVPVVAALGIEATFTGSGRLPSRPMEPLLEILQQNGVEVDKGFPIHIKGKLESGIFRIQGNISSQFITGLLLAAPLCDEACVIEVVQPVESKDYLRITLDLMRGFGINVKCKNDIYLTCAAKYHAGYHCASGDWSNAAFWLASGVTVSGINPLSMQGDKFIMNILKDFGAEIFYMNGTYRAVMKNIHSTAIDASDIPDLIPIVSVIASTAVGKTLIFNASRLKAKESNRIESTAQLIKSLGGKVEITEDSLLIEGVEKLCGGTVDSFLDHRIVMAAAVAAEKCENDVVIKNAQAVNKSYPSFFERYKSLGGEIDVL